MFSSRGMCANLRTGVFEDNLQVKGSVQVNNILPLNGTGTVSVQGYTAVDDLVCVSANLSEGSLTQNATPYVFVADRAYTVLSVKEIHDSAGAVGSTADLVLRKSGSESTVITTPFDLTTADDTVQSATVNPLSVTLAKGDSLRIDATADFTGLVGCVVSIMLQQA